MARPKRNPLLKDAVELLGNLSDTDLSKVLVNLPGGHISTLLKDVVTKRRNADRDRLYREINERQKQIEELERAQRNDDSYHVDGD